jgi:serine/threonine protein kinase
MSSNAQPEWPRFGQPPLDRYDVIARIAWSGLGRVYHATDRASNREVAIKITWLDPGARPRFMATSRRNWEAVRRLRHPNIVAVHDIGEGDDFDYVVTQYAGGGTPYHLLREQSPLPVPDATCYTVQIAYALQYLHEQGIIHCGVTLSRILLEHPGSNHVLLTGFSIARIQSAADVAPTGSIVGVPECMAHEQAEGRDLDGRTDIYALGCALYHMLAGRPLFVVASPVAVLYQQVHVAPPAIRDFNASVPAELAHIVEMALAKRPDDRYASAEAFARALLPFAGKLPDLAN